MNIISAHKDPYENIYCVVRGHKDIILYPPTDYPWLKTKMCSQAIFVKDSSQKFSVKILKDEPNIPWIEINPLKPDLIVQIFLQSLRNHPNPQLTSLRNLST